MIRIPSDTKRHTAGTNSDLFGTIQYTKNIDLDEEGYIKLSPRTVQLLNEKTDGNLELPISFGRTNVGDITSFHIVTSEDPFDVSYSDSTFTVTEDTSANNPTYTLTAHGKWFHDIWVSTDDNGWYGLSSGGTWDAGDTSTLTTGKKHPIEVFRGKNRICFGDGDTVKMYSESGGTYTLDKTLTLPTDFEVVGLAYSNYKLGILTRTSVATVTGQNQEAFFFTWDGGASDVGQGIGIGAEAGIAVAAYKGSHVILTSLGQLRYFTGGGWEDLAQLPYYFRSVSQTTTTVSPDALFVEGDLIYINYNGRLKAYGSRYEQFLNSNPGGIWCYDPKVGLYHRYSPSISPVSLLTVTSANVNTGTNVMTATAGTIPSTGSLVRYLSDKSSQIGGLTTPSVYYCIKLSATTFSLATTKELALAGVAIDLTSTGASNNYFLALEVYDYGATYHKQLGGIASVGLGNTVANSLIYGSQLQDFDSISSYNTLNLVALGFESRGYFVTPKMQSQAIQDKGQKIFVKYRPLDTGDSIIVKVKDKDLVGLPVSTPQERTSDVNQCSWTGANAFFTTADLSPAKTAFDAGYELECEVIAGAAAGTLTKISDITYSSGTYSVTLSENVDGAASSRYCDIVINNWRVLGTITSADVDGYKAFAVDSASTWFKFKVELRGVNTTVEEINFVNSVHKPAA